MARALTATRSGPSRRQRRNGGDASRDTRQAVLSATERLLASSRLDELTVVDLIEDAGISRASFYVHFECKHAAVAALAENAMEQIHDRLGIADANIVSARELGAEEKRKLEGGVAKVTGKKLRVRYSLDQKLMGGVVVKVGSTIYDGSVRGQLQKMKEQLTAL